MVTTSYDSITLRWDVNELDSEDKEFVLHFKEEKSVQWIQKRLKTQRNHFVLDSTDGKSLIKCGTKYLLYMTATNSLGTGEPSMTSIKCQFFLKSFNQFVVNLLKGETISTSTKGSAPVSPSREEFIFPNSTSVALRLSSWQSGGCPINHFTIKYRLSHQKQWIILKEKLLNRFEPFYIYHLSPGNEYDLFVGAHTDAGMALDLISYSIN